VDPGTVRPAVLRAMWQGLHAVLISDQAQALDQASASVGLAGIWAAITQEPRARQALAVVIRGAIESAVRDPDRWRRIGSDIVSQALYVAGEPVPIPIPASPPASASDTDPSAAQSLAALDPPVHHRYAGKLVARLPAPGQRPSQ
jgi:hypothetical protein